MWDNFLSGSRIRLIITANGFAFVLVEASSIRRLPRQRNYDKVRELYRNLSQDILQNGNAIFGIEPKKKLDKKN